MNVHRWVGLFLLGGLSCCAGGSAGDYASASGGEASGDGDVPQTGGSSQNGDSECSNCSNGCCNGDTCIPFAIQTADQCGTAGEACKGCDFGLTCSNTGMCETDWDVCSPLTCSGCCDSESECVPPSEVNWGACGADGESCSACTYGVVCDGTCTSEMASNSVWLIVIDSMEAHNVNSSGNWDLDGSAPELQVCLEVDSVEEECTESACPNDSYVCSPNYQFSTLVSGEQLADGLVTLWFYDEDVLSREFAGGVTIQPTEVPVQQREFEWAGSTGMKKVTYSLE